MTTAISFPDRFGSLMRGLLKKNIPTMVYLAIIGFIGIPLPYLLAMFRRWRENGAWVYQNINTADKGGLYVGVAVATVCILWLAGSFILALGGVGYMHNRRAVDLYHSMPVTRGQLLLSHVLTSFITVALPMTANTLLTAALAAARHGMTPDRAAFSPGGVALDLLGWYVTAFAVIVTVYLAATQVGSTFDTFMFAGVYLAALPVLCLTHMLMCGSFLAGWDYEMKWEVFCTITPVLTMIGSYGNYGRWLYGALSLWLVLGLVLLWAAIRLYIRRPSERAESRSRVGFAAGVFRFVATFVGGLGMGTLFAGITDTDSKAAQLIWIAVFALAVYFFVELILGRGFKGMKRRSVIVGAAMAAATVLYAGLIFTGGMGFEKRVPPAERVAGVTINYRGRYGGAPLYNAEKRHTQGQHNRYGEVYSYDQVFETTLRGPEAIEAVTALHRMLAADNGKTLQSGDGRYMGLVEIVYTYNDGREMKRAYFTYGDDELLAAYAALEDTDEFRSRVNPLYYWTAAENPYKEIDLCDATGLNTLALTDADAAAALTAALREDLLAEKAMDYYDPDRRTVCYLYLQSELEERYTYEPASKNFYGSFTVPVGESYRNTLALLTEWGLEEYLTPAEYDGIAVSSWGCEVAATGKIIVPLWYGVSYENFTLDSYDCVMLNRADAEPLLQKATWTHPNTGNDDCLYLSFVRVEADGTAVYGLPMFLPLKEAWDEPLLQDFLEEHYGYDSPATETEYTTLEAR